MAERHEPPVRHAVDDLPTRIVARQAERAGWVRSVNKPLSPKRLPATLSVAPGLAHRRNARLLGLVALGFLALLAVSLLVAGGLDEPEVALLSLVPVAVAGGGALWHLMKARTTPARFRLTLSETGVGVEADGRVWTAPLSTFQGVALRSHVTQKANPNARRHRTLAQMKERVGEEIRLYWVELTHADPEQSIPLWASNAPFAASDGVATSRAFAARLGLPLLSTAGIASVWDAAPPPGSRKGRRKG